MSQKKLRELNSCGFIIFRKNGNDFEFLLMKHRNRYDLCKGHFEERDKTFINTAFRELDEETGIKKKDIEMIKEFKFQTDYYPFYKRFQEKVHKTVTIFLGYLKDGNQILKLTEHKGYNWIKYKKGIQIQKNTIDPLLQKLDNFFEKKNISKSFNFE